MVKITIAIPTYNGANRLPKLLECLQQQQGTEGLTWEILVVDNNSKDNTAQVVQAYQQNWPSSVPLRYCFELQQGAAFARLRAVQEAKGDLIGFVDDDVLLQQDWVATACQFGLEHSNAGAWGGRMHGEFEVPPPANLGIMKMWLALIDRGPAAQLFDPENLFLPATAALVVRRKTWLESVPKRPLLRGRVGSSLLGGEDYEVLLHLHRQGWEIWYNPHMQAYHQIPASRLTQEYLTSLGQSCGLPICTLRMVNAKNWQKPIVFCKVLFGNLKRSIFYFLRNYHQLETDLLARCEMAYHISSLMSPFYYLRLSFSQQSTPSETHETPNSTHPFSR